MDANEMYFSEQQDDLEILVTFRGDISKAAIYLSGVTKNKDPIIYRYCLDSDQLLNRGICLHSSLTTIEDNFLAYGERISQEDHFKLKRYCVSASKACDFVGLMNEHLEEQPSNTYKREMNYWFFEGKIDELKWVKSLLARFKIEVKEEDFLSDETTQGCLMM